MFDDVPDWPNASILSESAPKRQLSNKVDKAVDVQLPESLRLKLTIEQFSAKDEHKDKRAVFTNPRAVFETRYTRNQESADFRIG